MREAAARPAPPPYQMSSFAIAPLPLLVPPPPPDGARGHTTPHQATRRKERGFAMRCAVSSRGKAAKTTIR